MAVAERKRKNKPNNVSQEEWAELFKLYSEGHSITTCATVFKLGHEIITKRLKENGLVKSEHEIHKDKARKSRLQLIPKGRFADLYK
jgi:DNA invertase Pin-like site-specific DNA recombinase